MNTNKIESKIWTKEEIINLLENNRTMVIRSLMQLYNLQTADEKGSLHTNESNGVGFNQFDSRILTSIAEFYDSHRFLSEKQMYVVKRRIKKYAGQLTKIANKQIA